MRAVVLGDHHQAGGVLVEPVHDARPLHPADAGEAVAAMGDQRIHQRSRGVSGGRMHHEPCRLVDDDDVLVLIDDVERDVFSRRLGLLGLGHVHHDQVARIDAMARIKDRAAAGTSIEIVSPGPT